MNDKPTIKIIATGGTIAGEGTSSTMTTGYQPGALSIDKLLDAVPDLEEISNIQIEQLFNIDSVDMTNERMLALGKYINKTLSDDEVDGVVVTHGTDTLEETAYFLHLVVKSHKPVVIVGAVRPATTMSAEGPLNIYNGVKVASDEKSHGKGVLVVLNDRIGSARFITKMNTTMVDSFKAFEQGYIGTIVGGEVYYFYNDINYSHTVQTPFDINEIKEMAMVSIIYAHQGDERYLYDAAVRSGAKGIVVATTGGYTLSEHAQSGIRDAISKGVVIVRSSRLNVGIVSHTDMDAEHGYIVSESLNPGKARVLLMLSLNLTTDKNEIQKHFYLY